MKTENFKIKSSSKLIVITAAIATLASANSHAFSPINRAYQSVRNAGMGNVRYTTGFYEENFYANPARAAANPENLFQFPKLTLEAGLDTIQSGADIASSDGLTGVAGAIGDPISARVQVMAFAIHDYEWFNEFWSMSFGLPMSFQMAGQISQSNNVDPNIIIGAGPALTIARRLLPDDRLAIGVTTHFESRFTTGEPFSLVDLLKGDTLADHQGGSGVQLDFDLGATFRPHWGLGGFYYETSFAINNILGGTYRNMGGKIKGWLGDPTPTKRAFNFGLAARRRNLWKFEHFVMALELNDIGNNTNGSIFRTLHFGTEARWSVIDLRAGINQGYLCGGLGFDLKYVQINLATYGEEMGLNTGSLEDRRFALDLGFQI
jgi:hypothetical protein